MKISNLFFYLFLAILIFSCKNTDLTNNKAITFAVVKIYPTEGNKTGGQVSFALENNSIHVKGEITGLKPGKHGIHIHEFGDLTKNDGTSAGGHYNPGNESHAGLDSERRHEGDLGNIEADKDGKAIIDITDSKLSLNGNNSIIGRGLIIHEKEDDFKTQPTGNSGNRIGFGVIGIGNPPKL